MQLRWLVLQEEGHPLVHVGRLDEVVVVEDQQQVLRQSAQVVEQGGERRLGGRAGTTSSSRNASAPTPVDRRPIAVTTYVQNSAASLSRWSSETHATAGAPGREGGQPLGEQGGLAEAGGRGQHRQPGTERRVQALVQAGAGNRVWAAAGDAVLALEEDNCHCRTASWKTIRRAARSGRLAPW